MGGLTYFFLQPAHREILPDIKYKLNGLCSMSLSFEGSVIVWDTMTLHIPPETFCVFTLVSAGACWSGTRGGGNKLKLQDGSEWLCL